MGGINWCTLFMSRNKKYHFRLFSGNISNTICPLYKYLLFTIQFEGKCFIYILSAVLTTPASPVSVTISTAWLAVLAKTLKMSSLLQLTDLEEKLQMVERRQKNIKLLIIRQQHPTNTRQQIIITSFYLYDNFYRGKLLVLIIRIKNNSRKYFSSQHPSW